MNTNNARRDTNVNTWNVSEVDYVNTGHVDGDYDYVHPDEYIHRDEAGGDGPTNTTCASEGHPGRGDVVDTGDGYVNTGGDGHVKTRDNSYVNTRGESDVNTRGESDVNTRGESDVNTRGESDVNTRGESDVNTRGESDVNTRGESDVNTRGESYVNTRGESDVNTCGESYVNTRGESDVNTRGESYVNTVGESDVNTDVTDIAYVDMSGTDTHDATSSIIYENVCFSQCHELSNPVESFLQNDTQPHYELMTPPTSPYQNVGPTEPSVDDNDVLPRNEEYEVFNFV